MNSNFQSKINLMTEELVGRMVKNETLLGALEGVFKAEMSRVGIEVGGFAEGFLSVK